MAREENAVIVDMGGTTTDVAIVRDKRPVTARKANFYWKMENHGERAVRRYLRTSEGTVLSGLRMTGCIWIHAV